MQNYNIQIHSPMTNLNENTKNTSMLCSSKVYKILHSDKTFIPHIHLAYDIGINTYYIGKK